MQRKILIIIAAVVLTTAGTTVWYFGNHRSVSADALTLYGNVDIRQVRLAFNNSERIATMCAREGEQVKKGPLLATLDTVRLRAMPICSRLNWHRSGRRSHVWRQAAGPRKSARHMPKSKPRASPPTTPGKIIKGYANFLPEKAVFTSPLH